MADLLFNADDRVRRYLLAMINKNINAVRRFLAKNRDLDFKQLYALAVINEKTLDEMNFEVDFVEIEELYNNAQYLLLMDPDNNKLIPTAFKLFGKTCRLCRNILFVVVEMSRQETTNAEEIWTRIDNKVLKEVTERQLYEEGGIYSKRFYR